MTRGASVHALLVLCTSPAGTPTLRPTPTLVPTRHRPRHHRHRHRHRPHNRHPLVDRAVRTSASPCVPRHHRAERAPGNLGLGIDATDQPPASGLRVPVQIKTTTCDGSGRNLIPSARREASGTAWRCPRCPRCQPAGSTPMMCVGCSAHSESGERWWWSR